MRLEGSVTCLNLERVPISYPESSGFLVQSGYEIEHAQYELTRPVEVVGRGSFLFMTTVQEDPMETLPAG